MESLIKKQSDSQPPLPHLDKPLPHPGCRLEGGAEAPGTAEGTVLNRRWGRAQVDSGALWPQPLPSRPPEHWQPGVGLWARLGEAGRLMGSGAAIRVVGQGDEAPGADRGLPPAVLEGSEASGSLAESLEVK